MRSYLLVLFVSLFMLFGCKTTQQPDKQTKVNTDTVILHHFEPSNTVDSALTEKNTKPAKQTTKLKSIKPLNIESTARSADLWQYIANNLSFKIGVNNAVKKRIKWYTKQPTYLKVVNERAAPYLYHIVTRIKRQGLPMEIALLPFVESDFRPSISSSQQAVGVWQLVGATAHHFGIKSDQWYDGRKDVLASTDAAIAYLKYLYKRFNGNWLHAIAAYNSGEGRVLKAIAENEKRGKSTNYWALDLPKETAEYVPKLLALSYLIQNPQHGFRRPKLANKALTTTFNIGQQFDISVIAKLSGIGNKKLHKLNPGYLKNQSSPDGPHTLLLPVEQQSLLNSQFFKSNFAGEYIVKKDDTLYSISRRFNLSVKRLKMLNNKSANLINIGETLIVGQPSTMPESLTIDYKISPYLEPKEIVIPTITIEYEVKPGDTIWAISQLYNVSHRDLAKWNKLSASSILKPGSVLVLYIPQASKPKTKPANKSLLLNLEKTLKQTR